MNLQALCPECRQPVAAMTMLSGDRLQNALSSKLQIRVMHTTPTRLDHYWSLSDQDKKNLAKLIGAPDGETGEERG